MVYEAGGRKFAFHNLAPLGCLPVVKQEKGNEKECVNLPSEMAALHNKNLLKLMEKLEQDLESFHYSFYDFFSSIQNRVFEPETYSESIYDQYKSIKSMFFKPGLMFCVGAAFGTGTAACCGTGSLNGTGCAASNVCGKPEEYVFFDGKHLTQEANFQVAHLMWNADRQVVGPNNLRELLLLPLDIAAAIGSRQTKRLDQVGEAGSFVI